MGGAKRYPSIAFRGGDGFREELNPSYGLTTTPAQVICPSGGLLTGVSSPICKNIFLSAHPKSSLERFPSRPERGAYHDRHGRWVGMRWTRQRFACDGVAGRVERSVSDHKHADERCCRGRQNRVVLTPRRWRQVLRRRVGPTGRGHSIFADDGGKRARSPGRARHKPLKPLRRECRVFRGTCGDYRVLTTNAHGLRVQRAPGVPCTLFGRKNSCTARAHRVASAESYVRTTLPFEN